MFQLFVKTCDNSDSDQGPIVDQGPKNALQLKKYHNLVHFYHTVVMNKTKTNYK